MIGASFTAEWIGRERGGGPMAENSAAPITAPARADGFRATEDRPMDHVDWAGQDWEDLVPRLLVLASSRLSRMVWRGRADGSSPGTAEDFVNDAIAKTIAGLRVWNREACTLFQHLAGVIVSDVSHAANSPDNRRVVACDDHASAGDPATTDQEQVALWNAERRRLLDHLSDVDPTMGRMAQLMLIHDLRETADLCRELNVVPAQVANLRKRLKRVVRGYLQEDRP